MAEAIASAVLCLSCSADTLLIGASRIDERALRRAKGRPEEEWMRRARDDSGYTEQTVRCCPRCGLVFVSPALPDEQKRAIFIKSAGTGTTARSDWISAARRPKTEADDKKELDPSPSSFAVRAPSLDASLDGLLTDATRVLDIGAVRGEPTAHIRLPRGSTVDLLQAEPSDPVPIWQKTRQRNGLLADLRGSDERWDLVLALHVIQQVEDPRAFLADAVALMAEGGLLVLEVPYELQAVWSIATNEAFTIPHTTFFAPWSLRTLLAGQPLDVLEMELLDLFHTGVGDTPFPVIRAVCRKRSDSKPTNRTRNSFIQTIDRICRNFAGSIAYNGKASFRVFVYSEEQMSLPNLLRSAPGFRGLTSSNRALDVPYVFDPATLESVDNIITLHPSHRADLLAALDWHWMVI